METFIKADIFFFITAVSVAIVTALVVINLIYFMRLLRNLTDMSERLKTEFREMADDMRDLRENIKHKGVRLAQLIQWIDGFRDHKQIGSKNHKTNGKTTNGKTK